MNSSTGSMPLTCRKWTTRIHSTRERCARDSTYPQRRVEMLDGEGGCSGRAEVVDGNRIARIV